MIKYVEIIETILTQLSQQIIIDTNVELLGGYYDKYIKYKQKYMELKNNI